MGMTMFRDASSRHVRAGDMIDCRGGEGSDAPFNMQHRRAGDLALVRQLALGTLAVLCQRLPLLKYILYGYMQGT